MEPPNSYDQAPDTGSTHLPQYRVLPAADPGALCRDARELAGGQPLSEDVAPGGAEERSAETGRLRAAAKANRVNVLVDHICIA